MKILFLLLNYKKDNLYGELVREFLDKGHDIYVATILERKYKINTNLNEINGIKILQIRSGNMFETNFIEKGLTSLSCGYLFKKNIKKYFDNIEFNLVIYHTPPITFGSVIKWLKEKYDVKSYLILRDIFPQNAKDLGIIKNKFIFNFFRKKEKQLYEYSDYIGCMSSGNINFIKNNNPEVQSSKLHILRNWGKIKEQIKTNRQMIRQKYSYNSDDFIVVFGGNMGKPQALSFLLKLAEHTQDIKNIKYLLVGKGNERDGLKKIALEKQLKNIRFIDFVPREEYELLISACDIGIVSLSSCFTIPNIPSKTIDYFKLSLPILAFTDKNTDYPIILEKESKGGLACLYGDINSAREKLLEFYNNDELRFQLGKNGRHYYEKKLDVEIAYNTILEQYKKLDD